MAEYYTVLRRAIAGIDPNVPETRRAVYDKARNALIGQLKAVDPPLTTAEISRQRLELEEAIRRVEREAAAGVSVPMPQPVAGRGAPPPSHLEAAEPAISMPPAHDFEPAPPPSPQEVFRRAIQEAGMRGAQTGAARPEYARYEGSAAPDLRSQVPARDRAPPPEPARRHEPPDRMAQPVRSGDPARYQPPAYRQRGPQQEPYRPPLPAHEEYDAEPRLAPEYDQDWDAQQAAVQPAKPDRRAAAQAAPEPRQSRRRGYSVPPPEDTEERQPRRSRLGAVILTVLILAVLGGVGVFAWTQRSMITDLLAGFDSGSGGGKNKPVLPPSPDEAAAAAADSGKNTDRLLPGEAPPPGSDVRVVAAEPLPGGETADGTSPALAVASAPTAGTGGGQKAILYEEPVGGEGGEATVQAIDANVTWRFVGDGPNGPEVEANLEVPARDMTIRFSLHKNADDTLPASHLIEVVVDTPADFPGQSIGSIPRIVLKPTEGARGQPLVGAAAKVADGFFWIALSAAESDIAANLSLMRERNWIDLPFVYENGQRAILTFEKGPDGEAAFRQAFAAWGTG
jgi:hypothetical protein